MRPAFALTMKRLLPAALTLLLAACGGGGPAPLPPPPGEDCSPLARNLWLRDELNDWYFWNQLSPRPDPAAYASTDDFFAASLYTGSSPDFPADRWSTSESTESFNRFFGEGRALGYGMAVAALEISGQPDRPLRVRYVEPLSDAAAQGVQRGDQVVSINGRSAADLISAGDLSVLNAGAAGDSIALVLRQAGVERRLTLVATNHALTPVQGARIVSSPAGRRMGYVMVKDMISQALTPLDTAFAQLRTAGVADVVLDLRYNGGGLVSVASTVGSYVAGAPAVGREFATLLFNRQRAADNNQSFLFADFGAALGLRRVFVLAGPRTCSASEQVINGLRGVGVQVVAIGDTSCGKPVGYLPVPHCGTTWSAVNFESVNERFEGRYFDGFAPTCAVADDLQHALGSPDEALLSAARSYADTGVCPVPAAPLVSVRTRRTAAPLLEPGERGGMILR